MGNILFHATDDLTPEFVASLMRETGFNRSQISRLYIRFQHLDKEKKGFLTKEDLVKIPQVGINPVGEKVVEAFLPRNRLDANGKPVDSSRISFAQFVNTFAVFRPIHKSKAGNQEAPNSKENKTRFLFNMLDSSRSGEISKEEIYDLLEMMVGAQVNQEQLDMIADRIIVEADKTQTGSITFEEFKNACHEIDIEGKMAFVSFY